MAEEKYTALVVDQLFELLNRLFRDEEKRGFFISNRTLYSLFDRVREHLAKAFPRELEQVTLRLMQNKIEGFRKELLEGGRIYEQIRDDRQEPISIIPEEVGKKALTIWCERPEFD
jgi:hypothetical protein